MRVQRRRGSEGSGVGVAVACVALAVTLYLVGVLVWQLEDDDGVAPLERFTMTLD